MCCQARPWDCIFCWSHPILTAGCILTHWVVSRLGTAPATEQVTALLWSRQTFRDETIELRGLPLWQNYRVQAALLMTLTAVIVWLFR
jgi:SSS family solute:Na+ symporter